MNRKRTLYTWKSGSEHLRDSIKKRIFYLLQFSSKSYRLIDSSFLTLRIEYKMDEEIIKQLFHSKTCMKRIIK